MRKRWTMMWPERFLQGSIALAACVMLSAIPAGCSGSGEEESTTQAPVTPAEPEEPPLEYVILQTSRGEILLELNREKAPLTVKNFLGYVEEGFYDGTIFHRVMPGFMIQGGGLTADLRPKATHGNVRNESSNGLLNDRGTIAMARTADPHSASSQFFINVVDNDGLNRAMARDGWGYAVFGRVLSGMDVADAIVAVRTTAKGDHETVPVEPNTLDKAERLTSDEAKAKQAEMGE